MPTATENLRRVSLPRRHPGQARVLAESVGKAARFNVLRCGRRWGKTSLGLDLAIDMALPNESRPGLPVGWVSGSYKLMAETWRDLKRLLKSVILKISEQEHRLELYGGGSIELWSLDRNEDAGRGRKYARLIIDEAGIAPTLRNAWLGALRATLVDYHGDAWFLGTPKEEVPYFSELFRLGELGVPGWASWQLPSTDNPHIDAASEIAEARRSGMPEWMVQREFFGIPNQSDTAVFPRAMIESHKHRHTADPIWRGWIRLRAAYERRSEAALRTGKRDAIEVVRDEAGPWRFWCNPRDVASDWPIAVGVDISWGMGASNSVMAAGNGDTCEMFAEYVCAGVSPEELAEAMACFGIWAAGRGGNQPWVYPERNGPGEKFIAHLKDIEYLNILRERTLPGDIGKGSSENSYGWWSDPGSKRTLIEDYRYALTRDRVVVPSAPALDETLTYRYDKRGNVVSDEDILRMSEADGARAPHGDRVIAPALMYAAIQATPFTQAEDQDPIPGTPAHRMRELELEEAGQEDDE